MAASTKNVYVTPLVRTSYTYLFVAKMGKDPKPGQRARFSSVGLILPKDKLSPTDLALRDALYKACLELAVEKIGRDKTAAMLKDGKQFLPFRKDIATAGYPEEFAEFIQPWSYDQPGVVSNFKDPNTGKPARITDPKVVYSGMWARFSVSPFYTDVEGNKRVSLLLRNAQKVCDDDRLDNRANAEDEFQATEEGSADELASLSGSGQTDGASSPPPANGADELSALLGG